MKNYLLKIICFLLMNSAMAQSEFITTWKTDNPGTSNDNQITIPTEGIGYNYSVDWGDGNTDDNVTGDITHTYASAGTYTVSITGDFPRIYFNSFFSLLADAEKIMSIEQWGDIVWTSMEHAFSGCKNLVINASDAPNLSGAISTKFMLGKAEALNSDLNNWDVSTITDMSAMFTGTSIFNGDISDWDVSSVENFASMFSATDNFNNDIGNWDVSSGKNFNAMFSAADGFNVNLNNWDMSQATNIGAMFANADLFNQPLNNWNVGNVTNMIQTFLGTQAFNQPLGNWDVSKVNNMKGMFQSAAVFNQSLNNWDVSNVITMESVFEGAREFNANISNWNLVKVTNTKRMFIFADDFNQDLSNWNVGTVVLMDDMFNRAISFNSDISNWDVAAVTSMSGMFFRATSFDKNLSKWNVSQVADMGEMFDESGLSTTSYDNTLIGWAAQTLQNGVALGAADAAYCNGAEARAILTDAPNNWIITDAGENCRPFITTWQTSAPGEQITIPTFGEGYNYTVDWGDGSSNGNVMGDISYTYASAGTHTITISGDFPRIYFNNAGDKDKILSIEQWGNIAWTSTEFAFAGCSNMVINATDAPDLSRATSMRYMFNNCDGLTDENLNNWDVSAINNMFGLFYIAANFNGNISNWDVSNVINMQAIFGNASAFNQDISNWNVGKVTQMKDVFFNASAFNQNISSWNTSSALVMRDMFRGAGSFNQDIGNWDVSGATTMQGMFAGAVSFDQDLSNWNVSSVTTMEQMLNNSGLSTLNYDGTLQGWAVQTVQPNVPLGAAGISYCLGESSRDILSNTPNNWSISDDGVNCVVNIPDANFKAVLLADPNINTTDDGEITVQEAQAFTGVINANYSNVNAVVSNTDGITDVTGLEYFTEVTDIFFNGNAQIEIGSPGITTLDVSNNTKLESINCSPCNLTALDVSNNPDLRLLRVLNNQITSIDVSNNLALQEVNVGNNNLTSLDISSNIDLRRLYFNENSIDAIDLSTVPLLTQLNASETALSALDVSSNPNLTTLRATEIGLNTIDVSQNTQLTTLFVASNSLSSIDLSNNTLLTDLRVQRNQLTSLDISTNTVIEKLFAGENLLSELNAKNGNNAIITIFSMIDNPNLTCITVDDIAYAETNFTDVDGLANFSTDCNVVDFVDSNFENALLADVTINTNNDAFIQVVEAVAFTGTIDVSNLSISDLTGIEAFTEITQLKANSNTLTEVDVSNNTKLEVLWIRDNALSAIDVSNNVQLTQLFLNGNEMTEIDLTSNVLMDELSLFDNNLSTIDISTLVDLTELSIRGNQLSSIDVSSNVNLLKLYIHSNSITTVDLSNNTLLTDLFCDNNSIASLDFTNNPNLRVLRTNNNELVSLDLSSNTALTQITVHTNQLSELNIANGNNSNFTLFEASNNGSLSCITVDDVAYAEANFTNVDAAANFSTDCSNTANDITAFSFTEQSSAATIGSGVIDIEVTVGTDLSSLTPTFSLSTGATVDPASGVAQDFSSAFIYTVTAENPTATQEWTVTVIEENVVPTDITLDNSDISENNSAGEIIGVLSTTDGNVADTHSYTLVAGAGDADNAAFAISGNELKAGESFDFETQSTYSMRIQANDGNGGTFEKAFTINVNNLENAAQSISFDELPSSTFGDGPFDLVASVTSGLPLTFESSNEEVASISGSTVTIVGAGTTEITATQSGNVDYASADAIIKTLTVEKATQEISFALVESLAYGAESLELQASSSSELAVSYTSADESIATINGNILNVVGIGTVTITASQIGNTNYLATEQSRELIVSPAQLNISADEVSRSYGEANPALSYSITGLVYQEDESILTTVPTITTEANEASDVGEYAITISGAEATNYTISYSNSVLVIEKANQEITIESIDDKILNAVDFEVVASTTSELELTYEVLSGPATNTGNFISLTGEIGNVEIQVSQSGNNNYNAATATTTFEVLPDPCEGFAATATLIQNVACNGVSDGSFEVNLINGTAPFSYTIGGESQDNGLFENLSVGSYEITVTDANGCSATTTATITEPDALAASATVLQNVDCNGGFDGSLEASVTGGTAPYSYSLAGANQNEGLFESLSAGSYDVTITDANGCSATATVEITEPEALEVTAETTDSNSILGNGSISLTVSGGTGNYSYDWSNGATSANLSDLGIGEYTVSITDEAGCNITESYSVGGVTANPEAFELNIYPNPVINQVQVVHGANVSQISLIDANGKIISQQKTEGDQTQLEMKALPAGMYFIRLDDGKMKRIIKQ